jgi:hypothetical protein
LRICGCKVSRFGAVALQSQQPKTEGEKGKNQLDLIDFQKIKCAN